MLKPDLVAAVAEKAGVTKKEAGAVIDAVLDTIVDTLKKGENVQLVGFGTFEVHRRAARKGRNPRTGATINLPAYRLPVFRAGRLLKGAVK